MNRTLTELDREWRELCRSASSRLALQRWAYAEPALAGILTLEAVLVERKDDAEAAPAILAALARLAASDDLAARTLLQALMPGLVKMAATSCSDDPAALDELVSLAWERIRTYPTSRPGPVAANVLMDVRKRYREHRTIEAPDGVGPEMPPGRDRAVCRGGRAGPLRHRRRHRCSSGRPHRRRRPRAHPAYPGRWRLLGAGRRRARVDGEAGQLHPVAGRTPPPTRTGHGQLMVHVLTERGSCTRCVICGYDLDRLVPRGHPVSPASPTRGWTSKRTEPTDLLGRGRTQRRWRPLLMGGGARGADGPQAPGRGAPRPSLEHSADGWGDAQAGPTRPAGCPGLS